MATVIEFLPPSDDEAQVFSAPAPRANVQSNRPKLLNQSVKILNKQAPAPEPQITFQNVTDNYDEDSMVTEIVFEPKIDPISVTDAVPVETHVFPCTQCARSFPLRQLLDLHMANHVRDRKFQCEECDKAFFSKYDLGKHLLIHSGEKPFKCVVCDKAFSRTTLLRRHEKVHSDQPKFLCLYCERPFLSKDELEKHTANHLKNRPFVCNICNKGFAFKQGLERHEVVHSTVQPYQCEHCEQSFSTQSKLARHLTAHAGSRPYPCRVCPKSFLLSHHLTRHLRSHKELDNTNQYKCMECSEVFETRDDLIYHSAVHATENLTCPLCKEQFDDIDDVTEHIKSHTEGDQFACEFCESIFLTDDRLRTHCDEEHADDLAAYDKDDRARESVKNKNAANIVVKSDDPDTELEEYIISDAILVDENGENIVDKQLISADELAEFGTGQLEFENNDEEPVPASEDEEAEDHCLVQVKQEAAPFPVGLSGQKNIKSYFAPAKKVVKEVPLAVAKAKPAAKPIPTPPKKQPTVAKAAPLVKPVPKISKEEPKLPVAAVKKSVVNAKAVEEKPEENVRSTRPLRRAPIATPPIKSASPKAPVGETKTSLRLAKNPAAPATNSAADAKLVNMKIGDRVVKVQQIRVTKSQMEAMAKEGKIEMKGGQMILKQKATGPNKK